MSSTPYPKDWPENMAKECAAIEGTYSNFSEPVPGQEGTQSLFSLMGLLGVSNRRGERITILLPSPESLEVSGIVDKRRFPNETTRVKCNNEGALEISYASGEIAELGPVRGARDITVQKATDGTLIVEKKELATALLGWIFPYHQRDTRWYRFRPVK